MYSHSKLSTFEDCPRRYAFRYIEKPPIEQQTTVEQFMGTAVHEALEKLYDSVRMERTPKWEEIKGYYDDWWEKNWQDSILIVRTEFTGEDYRNVGRRCLQDYFVAKFPFNQTRILGLEEHIVFDLDPSGQYKIQGYIDRLAQADDGTIEIHDYKTNRNLPSQEQINRNRQLALYQIGIENRWEDVGKVKLIWHFLRANRDLVVVRTRDSLEELRFDTIRLIDTIQDAEVLKDFPPHESMLCDWCEYRALCPAKRHLYATAAMTPEQFSADSGVVLADQFAAAKRRADAADEEVETLKRQIIAFAAQENLTRLRGHNVSLGLSTRIDTKIPSTDDPNRKLLDALVHQSGLWDKVSDLSKTKLARLLQTDLFAPDIKSQIDLMLRREPVTTIRLNTNLKESADDGPDV
jgi:putative RecB family exonuclease